MRLTDKEIVSNWEQFKHKLQEEFPTRYEALDKLYTELEERISMMPASGVEYYHNAFPGGYVAHILNVANCAKYQYDMWKHAGADLSGFTYEELMFAAFHHDLGKVGFPGEGNEVYIINESEWHRKNQGKIYTHNPRNPFTMVPDLSLYLLQYYNIPVSWNEYLGIRIHDGLYDEANRPYFISRSEDSKMRNPMPLILHHADHMAATIEYQNWKNSTETKIKEAPKQKTVTPAKQVTDLSAALNDLFA